MVQLGLALFVLHDDYHICQIQQAFALKFLQFKANSLRFMGFIKSNHN
jgi:hypothetical protein